MTKQFQVTIIESSLTAPSDADESAFEVRQHSRGSVVVERIDDLAKIWDQVIKRLTNLASNSSVVAAASNFELNEIEFNVGIEAGLNVGLVTKADASVSIKFSRIRQQQ